MYPNQPPQSNPNQPPQPQGGGAMPPYPPQPAAAQPQQANGYPSSYPQQQPQSQQFTPPQDQRQAQYYQEQPSLVPEGMASIDYLDKISSKQKKSGFTRKQVAIFGGLLLAAFGVLAALMIANGGGGQNITEMSQTLVVRSNALAEVATESQPNTRNQSLSNTNSALAVQLRSAHSSLTTAFSGAGVSVEKPNKKIVEAESNQELLEKFEDARLSGTFDRVYSREMSYQIEKTMILINDIHARTNKQELKESLESVYGNLEPLQKQLSEFSDTAGRGYRTNR